MLVSWLAGGHVNSEVSMLSDGACLVAVRVGIAVEEMGDDLLIFDTRSQRAHSLNAAGTVWRACDGQHTPAALAQRLGFDEDAVALALRSLSDCELLEHPLVSQGFVSRRALLRRLALAGAGAAVAVPIIRSVAVPSAAHAASLCTTFQDCPGGFFCNSLRACKPGVGYSIGAPCHEGSGSCPFPNQCVGASGYTYCVSSG
jgi:hypothetical protein